MEGFPNTMNTAEPHRGNVFTDCDSQPASPSTTCNTAQGCILTNEIVESCDAKDTAFCTAQIVCLASAVSQCAATSLQDDQTACGNEGGDSRCSYTTTSGQMQGDLTLAADASSTVNYYVGMTITAGGEVGEITAYDKDT